MERQAELSEKKQKRPFTVCILVLNAIQNKRKFGKNDFVRYGWISIVDLCIRMYVCVCMCEKDKRCIMWSLYIPN